jgi:hypothetical protein
VGVGLTPLTPPPSPTHPSLRGDHP